MVSAGVRENQAARRYAPGLGTHPLRKRLVQHDGRLWPKKLTRPWQLRHGPRADQYVSDILYGANPADLPTKSPPQTELLINVDAADAFGCGTAIGIA